MEDFKNWSTEALEDLIASYGADKSDDNRFAHEGSIYHLDDVNAAEEELERRNN